MAQSRLENPDQTQFEKIQRATFDGDSSLFTVEFYDRSGFGGTTSQFRFSLYDLFYHIQKACKAEMGLMIWWPCPNNNQKIVIYDWLDGWLKEPRQPLVSITVSDAFNLPTDANTFFSVS